MNYGYAILLFLIIAFQPPSPAYQKISTRYFDFLFSDADSAIAENLAGKADALAEVVMSYLGVTVEKTIEVRIEAGEEFDRVQPHSGTIPDWVSGIAYHHLSLIILKSPRSIRESTYEVGKTFIHELSHVLLGSAFTDGEHVPRWLNEGVAMYMSREWNFERVSTITQAVLTDSLLPLTEITRTFPQERREVELAYCQSFYLISFLITKYGKERFHSFIRYYSHARLLEDALLKVYGMNLSQLETRWHRYLRMRFSWIPLITSTTTLWFLITLIFLTGYIRKKRSANKTLQQWEKEELTRGGDDEFA